MQTFRKIVRFRRRSTQGLERRPPFLNRSRKPLRQLLNRPPHSGWISRLIQCIISNELATLDRLEERVMKLSGNASALGQPLVETGTQGVHGVAHTEPVKKNDEQNPSCKTGDDE